MIGAFYWLFLWNFKKESTNRFLRHSLFLQQFSVLFDEYALKGRRQQHVGRKRGEQPREERARKRHHVEGLTHGRKRDARSRQNAERSQPRHLPRGPAAQERNLGRTQHMEHQRLRPQRFHEPPRLKEAHEQELCARVQRLIRPPEHQRADVGIQQNERRNIEYRTGGPEPDHKPADR